MSTRQHTNANSPAAQLIQPPATPLNEYPQVIVANGHYFEPFTPPVPGLETCAGTVDITHSHKYRTPAPFAGKVVLVIGGGASGQDIAFEVASKVCAGAFCSDF